ncbi:SMI1/KNR4 family protein [Archangium violaceum]|uniref:SMI1/KNR4 family protein n=1 Tax=Archangium violaceum TaxID=83451 RepID=UPI00193C82CA|nr:SMI1/KNR4 family protein [Archangium violaceum]QRK12465.1 SMI1/KNR4 family protein [Archangium violaceum]
MMKELIGLASRCDPAFTGRIQGASPEEIARLEQLSERKLPDVYRELLSHMGRDMGGIGIAAVEFEINNLLRFLEEEGSAYDWPSRFLMIAEHKQDPYYHYFLDLDTLNDDGDCRVVSFDSTLEAHELDERHVHEQAPSLKALFLKLAFLCKCLGRFHHQEIAILTYPRLEKKSDNPLGALADFEQAALHLGFQKLPYSTPTALMLDRHDAAIYAKGGAIGRVAATLTGKDEHEILRIREILSDRAARN